MKTIDIQAREWFDKTYGNSYFSAIVTVDYCMESERQIKIPFTYGYGDYYKEAAFRALKNEGVISTELLSLRRWCEENGVILRSNIQKNCLKRDLINFVKD
jgi:hypothetical protein